MSSNNPFTVYFTVSNLSTTNNSVTAATFNYYSGMNGDRPVGLLGSSQFGGGANSSVTLFFGANRGGADQPPAYDSIQYVLASTAAVGGSIALTGAVVGGSLSVPVQTNSGGYSYVVISNPPGCLASTVLNMTYSLTTGGSLPFYSPDPGSKNTGQ